MYSAAGVVPSATPATPSYVRTHRPPTTRHCSPSRHRLGRTGRSTRSVSCGSPATLRRLPWRRQVPRVPRSRRRTASRDRATRTRRRNPGVGRRTRVSRAEPRPALAKHRLRMAAIPAERAHRVRRHGRWRSTIEFVERVLEQPITSRELEDVLLARANTSTQRSGARTSHKTSTFHASR